MCVSTLWDMGLISDQAVTGSLFLSSTILLLKLVMNYYLQSFPFILIERMTVVSYWQNPTPGPFVSIRWEHLGIISLPSSPINSKCGPSWVTIWFAHMSLKTREVLGYQWSNVRHSIFRSRFQRSISADQF